ncbi:hypothetical protein Tco_0521160 [Tanacetum coccineum]
MSQPANDEFHLNISVIPQTTAISNIKLPILKKEEYDIWAMEMEHYLEYIDNDVWKDWDLLHEDLEQIDDLDIEEMDINWQIAMIAIRMKKFYKKTGRRVRVDGKAPQRGHMMERRRETLFINQPRTGKQEKNQMGLLTMDDGIVNWGEHTEDEETNHALMAISSSSEVSLCSKTCIDSYNTLKTLCDEQMNQLGDQEAQILAYSQAVKKLEAQLGPQEPEPSVSDDRSSKCSTCQSNDSAGSIGTSSEHSVDLESEISRVPQKCLSHLIKDCDYYEKKMAREAAPKKQRVFNTGNGVTKPVWNNADRINHANHFVPRSVILNSGRPNVNSVRPNVNTVRTNINSVRQNVNSVRPKQPVPTSTSPNFSSERPQVNKFNQRSNFSKSHSSVRRPFAKNTAQMSHSHAVKGNWGSAVKTSAGYNWRPTRPNSNCNGGPTFIRTVITKGEEQVEDISPTTLEAAAILTKVQKIKSVDKGKRYKRRKSSKEFASTGLDFEEVSRREGKAPMTEEEETQASRKTKEQILQEEAGLAEAIRLDALEKALEKEEVAKQVHLDSLIAQRMAEEQELTEEQKKRKAQVQFEAQSYTEEDWDTIRAKLEANAELKESVLGKDLTVEDYAKRMVELVNQRRKHFAEERARAKRNKPMTQTQLRNYMSNFLKNQGTWKLTQLKKLNFEEVKAEFEKFELQTKTAKKLKFDDEGTQPTEEKIKEDKDDKPTKKTGKRRKQIARKGFHTDHDKDEAEDSDEANEKDDSTLGRKGVYQIVRENGTDRVYISFRAMLTDISRDDLTELYRIVMKKHGPQENLSWRNYDACRVHCLNLESADVYMLIERKYPLSAEVCKAMLDKKLQGGKPDKDCYKL